VRGDLYRLRSDKNTTGPEQRGPRYAVAIQSDGILLSTLIVAPTSTSAQPAIFRPEIEKYSPPFPEAQRPEFATAVNGIAAQLQKTIVATLDRSVAEVRKELAPKIHAAFEAAFAAEKARKAS